MAKLGMACVAMDLKAGSEVANAASVANICWQLTPVPVQGHYYTSHEFSGIPMAPQV